MWYKRYVKSNLLLSYTDMIASITAAAITSRSVRRISTDRMKEQNF